MPQDPLRDLRRHAGARQVRAERRTERVEVERLAVAVLEPDEIPLDNLRRQVDEPADRARLLDHADCESACYRCLKSCQNQRHHEHLSWPHVLPELEHLASAPPRRLPEKRSDRTDPGPWLEAYDAGVGSPLELKFLKLFEAHGLPVDKQVPVAANDGEQPISTADFVPCDAAARVAIYIDGAGFHRGQRLRRDRFIRRRLREGNVGWKVIELRSDDLRRAAALVEEIRREGAEPGP